MKSGPGHVRRDLDVSNEMLTSVDCVKLIGVQLDGKLNFDHLVSESCLRASLKISRIGRFISEDFRMKLYGFFILPKFLYCSIVWHFDSKSSTLKVERLNKRALWVVLNDYVSSYPELLLKTGRYSLYVSRIKTIATEMYKCKNYINPAFVGDLFTSHDPPSPYFLRNGDNLNNLLLIPNPLASMHFGMKLSKYGMNCRLISKALMIWMTKGKIRKWPGPSCRCQNCILCSM